MDGTALGSIIEALRSTTARPGPGGDAVALAELADLIALTGFVEQLTSGPGCTSRRARPSPRIWSRPRNTSQACVAP